MAIEIINSNDANGKKLIALRPILYLGRQYAEGDELPVNNAGMVEAWIDANSAKYVDMPVEEKPKAKPVTATPGLAGKASGSSEKSDSDGDLVGKIPATEKRKRK